jgi:hypothetical protein
LRAARNADGRLEIFGINAAGNIFHTWQTAPNNGWNGSWELLYTAANELAMLDVINNADGRLEIFGINAAGNIFHTWQTAPSNGWNGSWELLYTPANELRSLRAARNADGRLEIFGINAAGNIFHTWQTAPNNGWNGSWELLYTATNELAKLVPANDADGRLEIFGINAAGNVFHTWQTAPSNGWNGSWDPLNDPEDKLALLDVINNADGRLEVFGINTDEEILHTWQTAPNNGWVAPLTQYLGLIEQYQQQTNWCWAATTVSISLFYDPSSTWTQCSLVNQYSNLTTCCGDGSSAACNHGGWPDLSLPYTGNYVSMSGVDQAGTTDKPSFQTILGQINAGRPVSVAIWWNGGGGGHNPAVDGYDNTDSAAPTIDVQDPWYGPSTQDFNSFPSSYNGGATWGSSYFTQ